MTIYGSGGSGVREPRRLHPGVLALVAVAGIIIVAAIGYFALRSPAEPTPQAATVTAPGTPGQASPVASPSAAPSPAVADGLATGSWLVSATGDRGSFLSADGEFAAMSEDAVPLSVVKGLADEDCFSFRDGDGDYLRHFDYRLRFDSADDADDKDLFAKDATFCAEDDQPAGSFRVRSKNYPDYFLHRRDSKLYIDKPGDDDSDTFRSESTFTLRSPSAS
jgi:hypothetical protein